MEQIKISESVSLIILSPDEMHGHKPDKTFLYSVLKSALGYIPQSNGRGRLYVEMYPEKSGGCELFVTRLGGQRGEYKMSVTDEKICEGSEMRGTILRRKRAVYLFESLTSLLSCCKRLCTSTYSGKSSAYRDRDRKKYYLVLDRESHLAEEELGKLCRSQVFYYINEHCDLFCAEAAVETLEKFA